MNNCETWGWFQNDPVDICKNKIVADACWRGATIKVLSNNGVTAEVEYKGEKDAVPAAKLMRREAPEFSWGDKVIIVPKNMAAFVTDVCWHYKEKRYYYYLEDADGKAVKKRYFGDDLQRA